MMDLGIRTSARMYGYSGRPESALATATVSGWGGGEGFPGEKGERSYT